MNSFKSLTAAALVATIGTAAHGALSVNHEINAAIDGFDGDIAPSLITTGQSSLVSVANDGTVETFGGAFGFTGAGLNDGSAAAQSNLAFYIDLNPNPVTVTYELDQAYDITQVQVLSGWGAFLGSHAFTVLFEYGDSGTFVEFGDFATRGWSVASSADGVENLFSGGSDTFATRTTLTDGTGVVAAGVTSVQFVLTDPYPTIDLNANRFDGNVFRELSVNGTASIPEPGSLALLSLGGLCVLRRRRA